MDHVFTKTVRRRFFDSVSTDAHPTGCHIWALGLSSRGYGNFSIKDKTYSAHRLAYNYAFGPIPEGLFVLHHCDNRKCVNPEHLFLGTHGDNMRDMCQKGRGALCRANNPKAKLSPECVIEVKRLYFLEGITQVRIAKKFGVSQSAISQIVVDSKAARDIAIPKLKISL